MEASQALSNIPDQAMYENANTKTDQTDSPDSGHKEMSSDSLAYNLSQPETTAWYSPMSRLNSINNNSGSMSLNGIQSSVQSASSKPTNVVAITSLPNMNSFASFEYVTPKTLASLVGTGEYSMRPLNTVGRTGEFSVRPLNTTGGTGDFSVRPLNMTGGTGEFSSRPLNTTGVNVHGQEFNLQLKMTPSAAGAKTQEKQDLTKIITPVPSQDATGNRLDLNVKDVTPKLVPPPKVKRPSSRSPSVPHDVVTSPDSSNNNYSSSQSSSTSENSLNGEKRHSQERSRLSATDENLNRESKELNTLPRLTTSAGNKDTADRNMNNLSHSPNSKNSFISSTDSTTKLHLSFSDEENTENSEDSGVPQPPRTLDSMTFDEFEALAS